MTYKIKTLNEISPEGIKAFGKDYEISEEWGDPDAILVRSAQVCTDNYINLLAVGRAGVGVNNISVDNATEKGICVFNAPGANANAVAELVFIMLGFAARKIGPSLNFSQSLENEETDEIVREKVESNKFNYRGIELAGKRLGVIGLGKIGVRVANYGVQHRMNVFAYEPFPTMANIHYLNPEVSIQKKLYEVIDNTDVLTVHIPLSDKTRHLIDEKELKRINSGSIMVNLSRAEIFNNEALEQAISKQQVSYYITDFPNLRFLRNDRVICTPHLGASTAESEENCAIMVANQVKNYLEFGNIENSVNFPTIEAPPQKLTKNRLIIVNRDVPNMIAHVTTIIGAAGLNIHSLINESNGRVGYNVIDINTEFPEKVVNDIKKVENVIRVRLIEFKDID